MELQSLNCGVYAECLQDYRAKHSDQSWGISSGNFRGKEMEDGEWQTGKPPQVQFLGPRALKIEEMPQPTAYEFPMGARGGSLHAIKDSCFHL